MFPKDGADLLVVVPSEFVDRELEHLVAPFQAPPVVEGRYERRPASLGKKLVDLPDQVGTVSESVIKSQTSLTGRV
jgi:hypothetical protein